ncbi:rhomboid-like protein [Streptomyces sp. NPDC008238]
MLGSALWTESPAAFGLYVLCFEAVHAPAERRLGTRRRLGVAALAHVGASVRRAHPPRRPPWRLPCLLAAPGFLGYPWWPRVVRTPTSGTSSPC